jgi:hypothetical protein
MITYVILTIFSVVIIALISAKLYSPFWFHQPVYHIYEIYPRIRWSRAPYIKKIQPPKRGIFCTPNDVITTRIEDQQLKLFIDLLQGHYLNNDTNLYHHNEQTIQKVLTNGSYISGYHETELTEPAFHKKLNITVAYGMITSRPIDLFFLGFPAANLSVHYLDFICVHEKYRHHPSSSISRNLIQTHIYNHYHYHHPSPDTTFNGVYLFKKEIDMCKGIVPLLQTSAYTFILQPTSISRLPANYSIKCLNKSKVDLWREIYAQITRQFEICAMPSFPITVEWLSNERYVVYLAVYKEEKQEKIHGLYVFEDTHVSYETEMEKPHMLRLAASMVFGSDHMHDVNHLYFFRGFVHSLGALLLDQKKYGILEIPNISDNGFILERWREKYELRNETKIGYYLYNMVYPNMPIHPNRFLCL